MTSAPATPWPGERPLAERYAALRHPALAAVELSSDRAAGAVEIRPAALPADAAIPAELPAPTALRAVGEVALGLQALHELGLCHGAVRADSLRSVGNRWLLVGIARPASAADRQADVAALARLARELALPRDADDPGIAELSATASAPAVTAGEVGRTALALAGGARPAGLPSHRERKPPAAVSNPRAGERLDARRRRTRNRMLLVTAIVVIVGAALLKLLDTRGIVTVPNEVGRTQPAAVASLRHAGLVPSVTHTPDRTARPGTVVGQDPGAGERVRPGRTVTLRVAVVPGRAPSR